MNAIEATESGGKILITSGCDLKGHCIEVRVIDSGEGISPENIDRIFDPFFTSKEEGTGLGLAITHGIIEQHGGTVDVTSKIGSGTTFSIKLPLPQASGAADDS